MRISSLYIASLSFLTAACPINIGDVTVTDTATKGSDTSAGSTSGPSSTTGNPNTSNPDTTNADTTKADTTGPGTTNPDSAGTDTTDTGTGPNTTGLDTSTGPGTTGPGTTGDTTGGSSSTVGSSTTGGGADLNGWTKYRNVLIDNSLKNDLTDFQVYVEVTYDSDMLPDYADLRFTDETGTDLLPYWIELDTGPVKAYVWIRAPLIVADDITTIRMYYGNPNAAAGSDGFATFLFFDDFEAGQLDATKWKATAPIKVEFGQLKLTQGSVYTNKTASSFPGTTLEARAQWHAYEPNAGVSKLMAAQAQTDLANLIFIWFGGGLQGWDGQKFFSPQNENVGSIDAMNIHGLSLDSTDIWPRFNRGYSPSITMQLPYSYYVILGHPDGKLAQQKETRDIDVDWILVRRHAKPDPVTLIGGEKTP